MNKYEYFIIFMPDGSSLEIDEDMLVDHHINDGLLQLTFEENSYHVHKVWSGIQYKYNKPQ